MSGINSSTALWYASRATGVVALVLLTAVMLLGLLVSRARDDQPARATTVAQRRASLGRLGLPRFAVTGLHRNLSLLACVFVLAHVLTAVLDGYVHIPLAAAVVPLASSYERLWLGLGAVSLDLMLAVVVTSLLRRHLSRKAWRAVHLASYLSWPVAWVHSVFSSGDLREGPLFILAIVCAIAVVSGVLWRVTVAARDVPRAERVGVLMAAVHQLPRSRPGHRPAQPGAGRERTLTR